LPFFAVSLLTSGIKKLSLIVKMALSIQSHELGNILIKHNDHWRGAYYLKEDLTFTVDRTKAARFYLLKSGDTTILNGDRISANSGNRTLSIDDNNELHLIDRDHTMRGVTTFLIANGTDNTDPITFETNVYLISNRERRLALKYEWGMELINSGATDGTASASNYKPRSHPSLINDDYGTGTVSGVTAFQFSLERADGPITTVESSRNMIAKTDPTGQIKGFADLFENYHGALLLLLLLVILILCVVVSR
jgi:hypothetical protein